MPDEKKKTPRKISCLPCRTKKAKCDGGIPHCNRCVHNSRQNKCIYPKPKTYGRPPKNAIFHNQDTVVDITKEDINVIIPPVSTCREFIFENVIPITLPVQQQLIVTNSKQSLPRNLTQILDVERIFSLYAKRGDVLRKKLPDDHFVAPSKMSTLNQRFAWLSSILLHIALRRSCQLLELKSFFDPEITLGAFTKKEDFKVFFYMTDEKKSHGIQDNIISTPSPLDSIPTNQAIQLINHFFQFHPHSILLNKTKVLNSYWNDTIEPLLLCAIYGTTIYTCHQTLKSKYFVLWESHRNPFLDYAYTLLEQYFLKRDRYGVMESTTLDYYQATVILGIFETLFGLAKHGMTIISLSYMMGSDLGVFHNVDGVFNSEKMASLDVVDRELLINAYWASLRCTSFGHIELGLYLRESTLFHGQPFPPANIDTSASYQYDLLHNNHIPSSSHLIESFHTEMVISYFTSKLFGCIPKTEYNVFDTLLSTLDQCDMNGEMELEQQQLQYQALVQLLNSSDPYETVSDYQIKQVLNKFKIFIQEEGRKWSPSQKYMIETSYLIYSIHFQFPKPRNDVSPIRYQKNIAELDLSNTRISSRITKLLPITKTLVQTLELFIYQSDNEFGDENETSLSVLALGIMIAGLETAIQLTMFHYLLDKQSKHIQNQLQSLYFISKNSIWARYGPVSKTIQKEFKEFLKYHQISVTVNQQQHQADDNSLVPFVLPSNNNSNTNAATTLGVGAGEVPLLLMENNLSTFNNLQVDLDYYPEFDNSFFKEFDDLFQQHVIDVNVT